MQSPNNASRIALLLSPAYLWLTVAIFLPLSAMLFFSFLSEAPFGDRQWYVTLQHYKAFFERPVYSTLLFKSIKLSLIVTALCVLIGFPCAYVLAKVIKGRSREALFLLVILPFWSNSLVRVSLNAILPFDVSVNLMFSYPAVVIGLVHSYLPYVILTSYLALQAIDDSLIDAARSMGANFRTIGGRVIYGTSRTRWSRRYFLRHGDRRSVYGCVQLAAGCCALVYLVNRCAADSCASSTDTKNGHTMIKSAFLSGLGRAYLALVLFFLYMPIIVMAMMSFNHSEFYQLPFEFTTSWYEKLARNEEIIDAAWRSVWVAVVTTAIATILGTAASLAFYRYEFRSVLIGGHLR